MKICNMTLEHIPQIVELEKCCFSDPWSSFAFQSELHNPLSTWIVACDGEVVAGYVGSQSVMDEADMMNIAVSPTYRRMGVATKLMDALQTQLLKRGVGKLSLEVRKSNTAAISLYLQNGFHQVGLRPNYYRHPKEDALILQKEIK